MTFAELRESRQSSSSLEEQDAVMGGVCSEDMSAESTHSTVVTTPENAFFVSGGATTLKAGRPPAALPLSHGLVHNPTLESTSTQSATTSDSGMLLDMHMDQQMDQNLSSDLSRSASGDSGMGAYLPQPPTSPKSHHLLRQIREDQVGVELESETSDSSQHHPPRASSSSIPDENDEPYFTPAYTSAEIAHALSERFMEREDFAVATSMGFWSLFVVTMGVSTITPIRDAVALQVGVQHIPKLTLASSVLAFLSSVPIGWLFEAPDPSRRQLFKKMGFTRGETQGTSLALFYRFFAISVTCYAIGFQLVDLMKSDSLSWLPFSHWFQASLETPHISESDGLATIILSLLPFLLSKLGQVLYIAFFLVVHLMKLHAISLVWGVTTEAMEYEDVARKNHEQKLIRAGLEPRPSKTRLQRLALVGFGGTMGGILGSTLASSMVNTLHLPGLLLVSAVLLEISAELSTEMGNIMQRHWEEQQLFRSNPDLASLDPSMKRSTSLGSMKRVASGNSLYGQNLNSMRRTSSTHSMSQSFSAKSLSELDRSSSHAGSSQNNDNSRVPINIVQPVDDNTFTQRLLRGVTTILKSRLLMAIFTYNALFASTTVLLSFERAELVANRNPDSTDVMADTAFLAKINIASSVAVFAMQASGIGASLAQWFGPQGSLAIMPTIRLLGVLALAWWHRYSNGQPPNLILFLMLDECTRVVNLAIAKPVRESLWRGLSNEARYEAKPIVDTLANRWGAGSASFCVSVVSRLLIWVGMSQGTSEILGLPPVVFLCLLVAAWWLMVSLDLGQIRRRIDLELKKNE